jgi:hypothetical protein
MNLGIYSIGKVNEDRLQYLNQSLLRLFNSVHPDFLKTTIVRKPSKTFSQEEAMLIGDRFLYHGEAIVDIKLLDWFLKQRKFDGYVGIISEDIPLIGNYKCRIVPDSDDLQTFPELKDKLKEGYLTVYRNINGSSYSGKRVSVTSLMWQYNVHPHVTSKEEWLKQNEIVLRHEFLHSLGLKHHRFPHEKFEDIGKIMENFDKIYNFCVMGYEYQDSKATGTTSTAELCDEHMNELRQILEKS